MPLPDPRARVLLTVALPAALVLTLLAGFLLLVHPTGTIDTSSPSAVGGGGVSAGGTSAPRDRTAPVVPQAIDSVPTMTARPRPVDNGVDGRHVKARQHRPSAAERDADLARWIATGWVAPRSSSVPGTGSSVTRPDTGSPGTVSVPSAGSSAVAGATGGGTGSTGTVAGGGVADFVLSSFNVLGASHTLGGARGRASGVVRIRQAAQLLARHDVDVAGFQELQQVQARELLRVEGGSWSLFPGPGTGRDSENSVGWRTSAFELVRGTTFPIPYFDGRPRMMPVVLLRNRASGVEAWFVNVHNPAETSRYHHQQKWRTVATQREVALANRTRATGVPMFLTGDMNERASYFCRLTAGTDLHAAHGGSNGSGGCHAGRPRAVDWIFGGPAATFSGYDEDRTHLVDITTDHPVISTRVHVAGPTG